MKYKFHPEARAEFDDAIEYYKANGKELGERFRQKIEKAVKAVARNPAVWPIFKRDVRRFLPEIFPYSILCSQEDSYVLIVTVMHQSRDPDYWEDRLE